MQKRLLPAMVALGLGLSVLLLFLAALLSLFVTEDRRGAAQEVQSRRALETYASTSLQRLLAERLDAVSRRIDAVQEDPLVDDGGLEWVVDGVRVLPRGAAPGREAHLEAAYRALLNGASVRALKGEDPRDDRERLLRQLFAAEQRGDRAAIELAMRGFLEHRAHWQLAPADDLPLTLAALESLTLRATPSPVLLRALLRDGLLGDAPMEGLQRQVLRVWPRLTEGDLAFACAEVSRQSRRAALPVEDFEARCAARAVPLPAPDLGSDGKVLVGVAVWWARGGELRGGAVDLQGLADLLRADMRARGLLEDADGVRLEPLSSPTRLDAVQVAVDAPRFAASAAARRSALWSKSALVGVTALLGLFLAALSLVAQRRKLKLVELKADFVATVSHELRTPLASLRVMAETLEKRLAGSADAKDYPSRIVGEVDGLSFLVENILSFNRIDKGRWVARLAPVPLPALQALLEEDARSSAVVKVVAHFEGFEGLTVSGDAELLRLMLLNLQRNACRYNERDPVQLRWRAVREGPKVRLALQDNGVGIPLAHWAAVFREFERPAMPKGRGGAGSGLGLALCRRIARLHGGTLDLVSSSAEGSTFELTLSLVEVEASRRA